MAAKYWLKLYYEILDDPKMGKLRPATKWRFVECLLVAGERDEGGFIPDTDELAWRVRADTDQLETELLELVKAGILQKVDGRWFIPKFADRQKAASGAERVARFRERQKKREYYEEETQPSQHGNASVTNGYTDKIRLDTDTDTDEIQIQSAQGAKNSQPPVNLPIHLATPPMMNTWGEWQQYHKDRGRPVTHSTATRQFKQFNEWGEARAIAAMEYSIANNYTGLVEPKAAQANGKATAVDTTRERLRALGKGIEK